MNKMDMPIMTVARSVLFQNSHFDGFKEANADNYLDLILKNFTWTRRGDAENNPELKQPIAYNLIMQIQTRKIFAYQRSGKAYDESRLAGKWSWGLGGHIDKADSSAADPIQASLMREISEEVGIRPCRTPILLGFINDDLTEVGRVHFGLLYLLMTDAETLTPGDPEIAHGSFLSVDEIGGIAASPSHNVETWSQIAYQPLRQHLNAFPTQTSA